MCVTALAEPVQDLYKADIIRGVDFRTISHSFHCRVRRTCLLGLDWLWRHAPSAVLAAHRSTFYTGEGHLTAVTSDISHSGLHICAAFMALANAFPFFFPLQKAVMYKRQRRQARGAQSTDENITILSPFFCCEPVIRFVHQLD